MSEHHVLREAVFDKAAMKKYYIIGPMIPLVFTVILIPVIPIIVLITLFFVDRVINSMSCRLTERTLEIKKGWLNRVESTVPLEKVTDLQMYQGPIMRWLGLHGFKVETAGQTSGAAGGSLVNMVGIIDAPSFRQAVLDQRDAQTSSGQSKRVVTDDSGEEIDNAKVLVEIRDAMLRIESKLGDGQS